MRKVIAAFNMTLDGFCDHTTGIADDEMHLHYADLLQSAGVLIYGRVTYQLMENYWPAVLKNPTGNRSLDEFAVAIDSVPKIIFSRTLKNVEWESAKLAERELQEEITALKLEAGKDIFVGSRSLIVALLNADLVDEFQINVHPIIAAKGLPLLNNIHERIDLRLQKTKRFGCGAIILYYEPIKK
jgi:dihydrofolate reductase